MATDVILRNVKTSALTHAEMDQNFESLAVTVDAKTSDYTVLVADQNKVIEATITDGTITLPTLSNADGTDTNSFKVTVKNLDPTALTVDGNGAETIEGAADVSLLENEAATFQINNVADEWSMTSLQGPNLLGVTSTAAELNILDGVTSTAAELNILDGVTATAAELNFNDLTTGAGTGEASKALVLNSGSDITAGVDSFTATTFVGALTGNASTATTANGVSANAINQTAMADNAIGQGELKETTSNQSVSVADTAYGAIALTGGRFSLGWFLSTSANLTGSRACRIGGHNVQSTATIQIRNSSGSDPVTMYIYCTYIQASPPYSFNGINIIPGFIYILKDTATGVIEAVDIALDPPWAYHGPTNIAAKYYAKNAQDILVPYRDEYQYIVDGVDTGILMTGSKAQRDNLAARIKNEKDNNIMVPLEITHTLKNTDMGLYPHPFTANDNLAGKTVYMLDPFDPATEILLMMHEEDIRKGENTTATGIWDDAITIGVIHTPIQGAPVGVQIVKASW